MCTQLHFIVHSMFLDLAYGLTSRTTDCDDNDNNNINTSSDTSPGCGVGEAWMLLPAPDRTTECDGDGDDSDKGEDEVEVGRGVVMVTDTTVPPTPLPPPVLLPVLFCRMWLSRVWWGDTQPQSWRLKMVLSRQWNMAHRLSARQNHRALSFPATARNAHPAQKTATKTECDYLYGWTFKKKVTFAKILPKMVNPNDTARNAEEEGEEEGGGGGGGEEEEEEEEEEEW